ncbi:hypothetical protein [Actinophytocola sediminis]
MNADECLARYGLRPDPSVLPELRALLAHETEIERAAYAGESAADDIETDHELMRLVSAQLFGIGSLADVPLLWRAKRTSMDTSSAIDIQMLCGAGLDETEAYLSANGPEEALDYLRQCRDAGDFDDFTPAGRMVEYEWYYGV